MGAQTKPAATVHFGNFEFDCATGDLRRDGILLKLQPQPAKVLAVLVRRSGEVVTRQELAKEVWGSETFVDFEQGLNYAIRQIRTVLEDDAEQPQFLETLPKRGYRFIAPIVEQRTPLRTEPRVSSATKPPKRKRSWRYIVASAAVLVALVVGWLLIRTERSGTVNARRISSLAVLPLQNLSGDASQDYFADGMTDALITDLAQIGSMKVISRTSSMRYKQSNKSLPEIARELNVDGVVEGSVQRSGDRVRISAQLIEAQKDRHLWAESYERDVRDILELQGEVARDIATQISVKLTSDTQKRLSNPRQIEPAAYEDYLKGRYFFERWNTEGRSKGLAYFQRAVAKDQKFAAAYAGLADTLTMRSYFGESKTAEERARGIAAAQQALRLDGSLAEAHASIGLSLFLNFDWANAERELRTSVSLNPSCSRCHVWYAYYMTFVRRFPDAAVELNKAQTLDPVSSITYVVSGVNRYFSRDFDEAMRLYQKAIELDPSNPEAYKNLADVYLERQDCTEATKQFVRAEELAGQSQNALALTKAFGVSGCRGMLAKQLEFYADPGNPDYDPMYAADNAAMLGKKDLAFKFLAKAYEMRQGIVELPVEPELDSIRSDSRYADLLRRVGLAP